MSDDFSSAIHDIAARAGREHADTRERTGALRPAPLVGAARRRRRTRAVATSGVAALAVAAVALGADALGVRLDAAPLPASTETVAPSPTSSAAPSASANAAVLPVGDPSLPFGVCGSVVGAAPETPVTSNVVVETVLGATQVGVGGGLDVTTFERTPVGPDVTLTDARGPRLAIVHDGVVVAVAAHALAGRDPATVGDPFEWRAPFDTLLELDHPTWYDDGLMRVETGHVELSVCAPGEDGTGSPTGPVVPLPPGRYEVHPLLEVRPVGDGEADPPMPGNVEELPLEELPQVAASQPFTATGEPAAFTVTVEAATPVGDPAAPSTPAPVGDLTCGAPAPTPTDPGSALRLTARADAGKSVADGTLPLDAALLWAGPGRLLGEMSIGVQSLLVQDGTIVATAVDPIPAADLTVVPVGLGSGAPVDLSGPTHVAMCGAPDGGPTRPAAGVYEVYVVSALTVAEATAGGVEPGTVTLVAPPFTLQVAG